MSAKYLIETSAWLLYFDGGKGSNEVQRILESGSTATSLMAIAEIADKSEREGRAMAQTLRFIQKRSAILPLTITIAVRAAKLKHMLRKQNGKIGLADALQLATAHEADATLVTIDRDFAGVEGVMFVGEK